MTASRETGRRMKPRRILLSVATALAVGLTMAACTTETSPRPTPPAHPLSAETVEAEFDALVADAAEALLPLHPEAAFTPQEDTKNTTRGFYADDVIGCRYTTGSAQLRIDLGSIDPHLIEQALDPVLAEYGFGPAEVSQGDDPTWFDVRAADLNGSEFRLDGRGVNAIAVTSGAIPGLTAETCPVD